MCNQSDLRHLDLFAGIGGFALAAQMVGGIVTTQLVESDLYRQKVLAKNFPGVPIHGDIRTYTALPGEFDIISLGFPCQDISAAGTQKGITKETRSGLFFEAIRVIRMVRPRFVVVENVANLLANGMGTVLEELSQSGYDAEWSIVSCADVGGVHLRSRVWIVAYPSFNRLQESATRNALDYAERNHSTSEQGREAELYATVSGCQTTHSRNATANSLREGLESRKCSSGFPNEFGKPERSHCISGDSNCGRCSQQLSAPDKGRKKLRLRGGMQQAKEVVAGVCGNDDGVSCGMDRLIPYLMTLADLPELLPISTDDGDIPYRKERLESLGNAVVPHVAVIPFQRVKALAEQMTW